MRYRSFLCVIPFLPKTKYISPVALSCAVDLTHRIQVVRMAAGSTVGWYTLAKKTANDFFANFGLGRTRRNSLTRSQADERQRDIQQNGSRRNFAASFPAGDCIASDYLIAPASAADLNFDRGAVSPIFGEDAHSFNTIELQHFGEYEQLIPVGKRQPGVGHNFLPSSVTTVTYCDFCGEFCWGFINAVVRCSRCQYTCHPKCQARVTLDCRCASDSDSLKSVQDANTLLSYVSSTTGGPDSIADSDLFDNNNAIEAVEEDVVTMSRDLNMAEQPDEIPKGDALRNLIAEYNKHADGLEMTCDENGSTFHGFLRTHFNLTRPINVIAGEKPPTIYDVINSEDTVNESGRKTITSFYLPRNIVKVLHISSETTTQEMIVSLLRKFKIADNPKKFALYERHLVAGKTLQAKLTRIPEYQCPLRLALAWGSESEKRLVLQENEIADVADWEAFEIPELNNFIKILELEEKEYMKRIRHKYIIYRRYVKLEMSERKLSTDCFDSRKNFDVDHVTLPPVEPLSPTDSIDGETLGTQKGAEKDDDYDFNDSGTLKTQKGTQQDDDYDYNDSGTMRILKAS